MKSFGDHSCTPSLPADLKEVCSEAPGPIDKNLPARGSYAWRTYGDRK